MNDNPLKNNVGAGDRDKIGSAGIDLSEDTRAGSFMQQDSRVMFARSLSDEAEIYPIGEALARVPGAREYFGRAFRALHRDYPQDTEGGYFIRVKRGRRVSLPVQACLFLKTEKFRQRVHNIIIVEEDASLYLITGCTAARAALEGMHLGITESFYINGIKLKLMPANRYEAFTNCPTCSTAPGILNIEL
jgi:Fe-S cluster assembly scaffold protein SufB